MFQFGKMQLRAQSASCPRSTSPFGNVKRDMRSVILDESIDRNMLYIIQQRMRQHNRTGDRCANDVFSFLRIACVAENIYREDFILLQRKSDFGHGLTP